MNRWQAERSLYRSCDTNIEYTLVYWRLFASWFTRLRTCRRTTHSSTAIPKARPKASSTVTPIPQWGRSEEGKRRASACNHKGRQWMPAITTAPMGVLKPACNRHEIIVLHIRLCGTARQSLPTKKPQRSQCQDYRFFEEIASVLVHVSKIHKHTYKHIHTTEMRIASQFNISIYVYSN